MNDNGMTHTQPPGADNAATFNTLREALESARSKLLDRSLRNKLIHTNIESVRGRHIRVFNTQSFQVLQQLIEGKTVTFVAGAKALEEDGESQDSELYVPLNDETSLSHNEDDAAKGSQRGFRLRTSLTPDALQKKLLSLFYEGQTLEEEQGINVLYLALGFLEWREARQLEVPRFAPLVLIPVELIRDGTRDRFKLKLRSEDILTNFSLQAWLNEQFGLEFPSIPDDDFKIDTYFSLISSLIEKQKNWVVHENEIVLGFFSFSKFLLWRDLDPKNWPKAEQLTGHPLLSQIILRDRNNDACDIEDIPIINDGERLDDIFKPSDLVHITDADSSQAIAIQEAINGKNMVIQGPPGTGKSQTITNLIAGAVKRGKRVLFIAEKMAALNVVHSRLVKARLGTICLELHSRKATKIQVLGQIKEGMSDAVPPAWSAKTLSDLEYLQNILRAHSDRLHEPGPNERTPFELMGALALIKRRRTPTPDFFLPAAEKWTAGLVEVYVKRIKEFADRLGVAGVPANHPWRGASIETPSLLDQDRLRPHTEEFTKTAARLKLNADRVERLLNLQQGRRVNELRLCCSALDHLAVRPPGFDNLLISDEIADHSREIAVLVNDGERLAALRPFVEPYRELFDHLSPKAPVSELGKAWGHLTERPKNVGMLLLDQMVAEHRIELAILLEATRRKYELRDNLKTEIIPEAFDTEWFETRKCVATQGNSLFRWLSKSYRFEIAKLRGICRGALPKSQVARLSLLDRLVEERRNSDKALSLQHLTGVWGTNWHEAQTDWDKLQVALNWIEAAIGLEPQVKLRNEQAFILSDRSGPWPNSPGERSTLIDALTEFRNLERRIESRRYEQELLGKLWSGTDIDWNQIRSLLAWINGARVFEPLIKLRSREVLQSADVAAELSSVLSTSLEKTEAALGIIKQLFGLDQRHFLPGMTFDDISAGRLYDIAALWQEQFTRITEWPPIRNDLHWLESIGCQPLAERVFDGRISAAQLYNTFIMATYEAMWNCTKQPEIEKTLGDQLSSYVAQFRKADRDRINMASDEVRRAYIDQHPVGKSGEVGILVDETKKARKLKPVRKLVEEAGNAIQRFKPVFLMSPISVAQYLPPGKLGFDLCIIDEASQVRPEDALGAIARCKQLVVVGDNKQLPPTSFFNRIMGDDDDSYEEEVINSRVDGVRAAAVRDIDSILDLCSRFPERMLRWHYRSEHPSLIATSNRNFYQNKLMLPPSVFTKAGDYDSGLIFHRVKEGGYERGKTARNEIEAEDVAQAVLRHARKSPHLSLGIGTFSVAQRDAIRDRLEYLAAHNPDLDAFIRLGAHDEAVFIKNLENIQGDERDVIFISIGYGRDRDGRLTQQFGPVGRDGGERRLNVLITRARKRCEVFSSLVAEDIKSDGVPKPGVAALKEFLKLAKDGYTDLPSETHRGFDSDFEESVALAISELGYKLHPQVGMAGFFVDLGVLDPRNPDRYLLGVECDGAAYHSSIYARDRDRLRQQILEARGWKIHRIWSTDWFYRQDREIDKLKAALQTALVDGNLPKAEDHYPTDPVHNPDELGADEPLPVFDCEHEPQKRLVPYAVYSVLAPERKNGQPHELRTSRLVDLVTEIVSMEQPIHEEEIARRLAAAFDLQRAGSRIREAAFAGLQAARKGKALVNKGAFWRLYYAEDLPARDRSNLPSSHTARRPELICPTEIAQAARVVLRQSLALEHSELVIETAHAIGFARTSQDVAAVISGAIKNELSSELETDHLERLRLKGQR